MTPDSPETRLGRLETAVSALRERMSNVEQVLHTLQPLSNQTAVLAANMEHVEKALSALRKDWESDVRDFHDDVDKLYRLIDDREKERRMETASNRRWVWGLVVTIGLSLIASTVTILVAIGAAG